MTYDTNHALERLHCIIYNYVYAHTHTHVYLFVFSRLETFFYYYLYHILVHLSTGTEPFLDLCDL